jgi:hypothetical protein
MATPSNAESEYDPRDAFESELVSLTIADFLSVGKELDPFSNWVLAGASAVIYFVVSKYGQADSPIGREVSLLVLLMLVVSIGAGFLARYLSLQALMIARQRDRHPNQARLVIDRYHVAFPTGEPLAR